MILTRVDDQGVQLCVMPQFEQRFVEAGLDPNVEASQIIAIPAVASPCFESGNADDGLSDARQGRTGD